jgi:protocatechuate 3,4-dioxygenase beta subunit
MVFNTRGRRVVPATAATAMILAGLSISAPNASAAPGEFGGRVVMDFGADGTFDATGSQNDQGLGGILITAYDKAGAACGSTAARSDGSFLFNHACGATARLEFTWDSSQNRFLGLVPSHHGPDNGSTVQFVADGDLDVKAALLRPADFCGANPELVISCFFNGTATNDLATAKSLAKVAWTSSGDGRGNVNLLTQRQATGAVWGVATDRSRNTYSAAAIRRHIGMGPGGIAQIYKTDITGVTTPLVNLGAGFGSLDEAARGLGASDVPTFDDEAFAKAGRAGIGDLEVNDAGTIFYLTNLFTREVMSTPNATSPALISYGTPPLSCVDPGLARVFGVTARTYTAANGTPVDRIFVGTTCDAPTGQINAGVFQRDINPVDRQPVSEWTETVAIPTYESADTWGSANLYPWATWNDAVREKSMLIGSIDFDGNGDMTIGVLDRRGLQMSSNNYKSPGESPRDLEPYAGAAGDTIKACLNTSATYVLESAGSCGGITTGFSGVGHAGPGGGEFYGRDDWFGEGPATEAQGHPEISTGAVAVLPGSNLVATAAFDPNEWLTAGVRWFDQTTGTNPQNLTLTGDRLSTNPNNVDPGGLGKAAGVGDLELLCDQAPIEIGNRVWIDADGDGTQDSWELPAAGVQVELLDTNGSVLGSATSGANGTYYFSSKTIPLLTPNTPFALRIAGDQAALSGTVTTVANTDSGSGRDLRDSDGTSISGVSNGATLSFTTGIAGTTDHSVDFGFTPVYSLGNRVWMDSGDGGGTTNNGIQDGSEPGIANVTVSLFGVDTNGDPTGAALETQVTNPQGYYRFDGLRPGSYVVVVDTVASGSIFNSLGSSANAVAPANRVDRDDSGIDAPLGAGSVVPGGIASAVIRLGINDQFEPTGESDLPASGTPDPAADIYSNQTVDFGFVPSYSVGNKVWFDTDNDGRFDADELPIAGVAVSLMSDTGAVVATATTDANGHYRFDGLPSGDYLVRVDASNFASGPLVGYGSSTPTSADPDNNVDGDDNGINPASYAAGVASALVTLGGSSAEPTGEADRSSAGGEAPDARSNLTVDFGFMKTSIGNTVWYDTDNDGLLETGEPRLSGVVVNLVDANAVTIATAITDINGQYEFTSTTAGGALPLGADLRIVIPGGQTPLAGLEPSDTTGSLDAQNHGVASGADTLSAPFQVTPGVTGTTQNVNPSTATTVNPTLDFGFNAVLASLGDRVWIDSNRDGRQDADELGVAGVRVELVDAGGSVLKTTTTDADGNYRFVDLNPGTYSVRFDAATLPSQATFTAADQGTDDADSDAEPATGTTGTYTLTRRQYVPTVDAGIVFPQYSLGNMLWFDTNNNGRFDAGESRISGANVALLDSTGTPLPGRTTTTDADGFYRFDGLSAGTYAVLVTAANFQAAGTLNGYVSSTPTATDPNTDVDGDDNGLSPAAGGPAVNGVASGFVTLSGTAEPIVESPTSTAPGVASDNRSNLTVDFGFYRVAVGNTLWLDSNNNGTLEATESRLAGVVVNLVDNVGAVVGTATTGSDGVYLIDRTVTGDPIPTGVSLTIQIPGGQTPLGGLQPSDPTGTADSTNHGTLQGSTVVSPTFTLVPGLAAGGSVVAADLAFTQNLTLDFGFNSPLGALGDRVWFDTDGNGRQDAGETGVSNVSVELFNSGGTVVATTTTDGSGNYLFEGLAAGSYSVRFVPASLPSGYIFTVPNTGDDIGDSDADTATGVTSVVTVAARGVVLGVDAGILAVVVVTTTTTLPATSTTLPVTSTTLPVTSTTLPVTSTTTMDSTTTVATSTTTVPDSTTTTTPVTSTTTPVTSTTTTVVTSSTTVPDTTTTTLPVTSTSTVPDVTTTLPDSTTTLPGVTTSPSVSTTVAAPTSLTPGSSMLTPNPEVTQPLADQGIPASTLVAPLVTVLPASSTTTAPATSVPGTSPSTPRVGSLTSILFVNTNNNGVRDPDEPAVPGAEVLITGPNGFRQVVTTKEDGSYSVDGLVPGSYTVTVTGKGVPQGYEFLSAKTVTVEVLSNQVIVPIAEFRIGSTQQIAFTGNGTNTMRWGLVFLGVGVLAMSLGRRRAEVAED